MLLQLLTMSLHHHHPLPDDVVVVGVLQSPAPQLLHADDMMALLDCITYLEGGMGEEPGEWVRTPNEATNSSSGGDNN